MTEPQFLTVFGLLALLAVLLPFAIQAHRDRRWAARMDRLLGDRPL